MPDPDAGAWWLPREAFLARSDPYVDYADEAREPTHAPGPDGRALCGDTEGPVGEFPTCDACKGRK